MACGDASVVRPAVGEDGRARVAEASVEAGVPQLDDWLLGMLENRPHGPPRLPDGFGARRGGEPPIAAFQAPTSDAFARALVSGSGPGAARVLAVRPFSDSPFGPVQATVSTVRRDGFPRDGLDYVVVSTGDASFLPAEDTLLGVLGGLGRRSDLSGAGPLFDWGGLEVTLRLGRDASRLEFEYRYFSHDYWWSPGTPCPDPTLLCARTGETGDWGELVEVGIRDGRSSTLLASWTTQAEIGPSFPVATVGYFPLSNVGDLKRASLDVSAWAGRTVTLVFAAGDRNDFLFSGGLIVDNLTVTSRAPTADPGGPYAATEGTPLAFDGSGSSDPLGAGLGYRWDFGDGTTGAGPTPSHAYADDGTYTVTLTVTDAGGQSATASTMVAVANVAPVVQAGPDTLVLRYDTFTVTGSFTDPGADVWTAEADLGDGRPPVPLVLAADGSFSFSEAFPASGLHAVAVRVRDDDGGVGVDTVFVNVPDEIEARQDAFLRSRSKNRNEGANPALVLQDDNRVVVDFDLSGVSLAGVTRAYLVLTVDRGYRPRGNKAGTTIEAHRLSSPWMEGNGRSFGLPRSQRTSGSGPGVTWECPVDDNIRNGRRDCAFRWNGGDFDPRVSGSYVQQDDEYGRRLLDVTADVLRGGRSWAVLKAGGKGKIRYVAREGASGAARPPVLVLIRD
ncbi:MAG: PKD domain-containing protein [Gemmatimonadetes bacterium]|nr:MAG: PKD domain-containing protein [Gemmatimonadota bacterium]